jgi:hypothetical protein
MPSRKKIKYPELENSITLKVKTKAPEKWLLLDRETGQAYQGSSSGNWDKLLPIKKNIA